MIITWLGEYGWQVLPQVVLDVLYDPMALTARKSHHLIMIFTPREWLYYTQLRRVVIHGGAISFGLWSCVASAIVFI